ncbi:MAG: histidine phosphotransferase ChpT [Aliidongia sp.]|nr:histidine phosphotransferase ChpT [Aliidongia sp.]
MAETLDVMIAELLAARLCHELVSPVGAIANGVEILEDEPDFAGDAIALIGLSARNAARRLQFYRVSYGSTSPLADVLFNAAVTDFFSESKIVFEWRIAILPPGAGKLACNLLLVAAEALPRGGRITLDAGEGGGIAVTAAGEGVRLAEPIAALLGEPAVADQLSPRTVQAAFTAALAARMHWKVEIAHATVNELRLVGKEK